MDFSSPSIAALISAFYGSGSAAPGSAAPASTAPATASPATASPAAAPSSEHKCHYGSSCPLASTASAPTFVPNILDFFVVMSKPSASPSSDPLVTAFSNVRKFDNYLAQDAASIARIDESRLKLVAQRDKDVADRQVAVDTLLALVTEYNATYPGAIDTSLEPPLMYGAYLLHQETLAFNKRVAESRAQSNADAGAGAPVSAGTPVDASDDSDSDGDVSPTPVA